MHLVDEQKSPVRVEPELVLRVRKDQPGRFCSALTEGEQRKCSLLHLGPQIGSNETTGHHVIDRQRLVVGPGLRLGGWSDQRAVEQRVPAQALRQAVTVCRPRTLAVEPPQRRGGIARDGPTYHHLHRQGCHLNGDQCVRVRNRHHVVGHDVPGLVEPPRRELVEDLSLERDRRNNPVQCGQSVGGDQQPVPTVEAVRHADLPRPAIR